MQKKQLHLDGFFSFIEMFHFSWYLINWELSFTLPTFTTTLMKDNMLFSFLLTDLKWNYMASILN